MTTYVQRRLWRIDKGWGEKWRIKFYADEWYSDTFGEEKKYL